MNTKTVSELAELFGVTRQAMNNRVRQLEEKFVEKNDKNITVVNLDGIRELESLYNRVVTAEAEVVEDTESTEVAVKTSSDDATSKAYEMISALMADKNAEIERLNSQLESKDEQLSVKDSQIAEKDAQLNKQQSLLEQALMGQKNQQDFLEDVKNKIEAEGKRGFFSRLFGK